MSDKLDIYNRVTNKIIADLERGKLTWLQPWKAGRGAGDVSLPLRVNGKAYRGINIVMLWAATLENGYCSPVWLTYKQAIELGGQVRKGEKGSLVVFADRFTKVETNDKGEDKETEIHFMKGYTVFNADQVDNLPAHLYARPNGGEAKINRQEVVERFFAATGITIQHGGHQAFYSPSHNIVQMPRIEDFRDSESYYATLAHEAIHATRHETRLNRDFGRKRFGDEGYAMEELIAEIGAAFLCADLGITPETREDHAAYVASWLKVLGNDKKAIFTAASHAQRAAEFLHACQPGA